LKELYDVSKNIIMELKKDLCLEFLD